MTASFSRDAVTSAIGCRPRRSWTRRNSRLRSSLLVRPHWSERPPTAQPRRSPALQRRTEGHPSEPFRSKNVGGRLWVRGGKTPSEHVFTELPQVTDIARSAF